MLKKKLHNPDFLLFLSLIFWFSSLFFPALTNERGAVWDGFSILISGWVTTLFQTNFAWLTNCVIFFIYLGFYASKGRFIISSLLLSCMSLTTYFLSKVIHSERPSYIDVFGYGWGAILWFTSIFLLIIAIGLRLIKHAHASESKKLQKDLRIQGKCIYWLGLLLLITHSSYVGIKGATDHIFASTWEQQRLAATKTIYKRGWICSKERKTEQLSNFSGILQVTSNLPNNFSPPINPSAFLVNGIDTIIINYLEYQYDNRNLKIQPKQHIPTAELIITLQIGTKKNTEPLKAQLLITLKEFETEKIIFNETWDGSLFTSNKKQHFLFDECSLPRPENLLEKASNPDTDNPQKKQ